MKLNSDIVTQIVMSLKLRSLFPDGDDGQTAFEHVVTTLFRRDELNSKAAKVIGPGLWQVGTSLYLFERPKFQYDEERCKSLELSKISRLVSVPSSGDLTNSIASLKKRLPHGCRVLAAESDDLFRRIGEFEPFSLRYNSPPSQRRGIEQLRFRYDAELAKLHGKIQFVGMSVYKIEASEGIPMDRIYIPLRVVPEAAPERAEGSNPLDLLVPGGRHVILGDPGSGKSTLLRFIALAGTQPKLRSRYSTKDDGRLCLYVALRRYGDAIKERPGLSLFDYALEVLRADLGLKELSKDWLEYYLFARDAILLFDGLDELPDSGFKTRVREQVGKLLDDFPGNTTMMSSRIVGYEKEVRYDELGFSHHRIARLSLADIETFVGNWYAARIDNAAERERHVSDLVKIVRDHSNRAIRELAENPLLLTIISLVHRIDAVLPDQRVVLYQKCTETLLNTWHTWKYQPDQTVFRSKIERRNTARMEAIAYWMHCLLESTGMQERSVVRYEDLKDFLAQYIVASEKQTPGAADSLAAEFLVFVKERAGLLIEVGEGQYGFLHLTFQEYLAATFLRKNGEVGGVKVIWQLIEDNQRHINPRWHEVIRLLIGSLDREGSQEFLLVRLLPEQDDEHLMVRALIAGGCLVDSVDAAEAMSDSILDRILSASVRAKTIESLRGSQRLLDLWQQRGAVERNQIASVAQRMSSAKTDGLRLALTLGSLGWSVLELTPFLSMLGGPRARARIIYSDCIGDFEKRNELPARERELLAYSAAGAALDSSWGNMLSAVLAVWGPAEPTDYPRPALAHLLACFGFWRGPAEHLMENILRARLSEDQTLSGLLGGNRALNRDMVNSDRMDALRRVISANRKEKLRQEKDRTQAAQRALERSGKRLSLTPETPDRLPNSPSSWIFVLENPHAHDPILKFLCDALELSPQAHWSEFIRLRLLPQIPARITIAQPARWRQVEVAFEQGSAAESDVHHAASIILLDIWLWVTHSYENPQDSPFKQLADLTYEIDAPELRVAHCIRDIAHGKRSRQAELAAMVKSKDPVLHRLFQQACWI